MSWGCAYPHRGSRDDGCRHRGTARAPMQAPVGFLQQGVGLLLRQLGQRQREVGVGHWGVPQDTTLPGQDPRPGPSPSPLHHRLHHYVTGGRGWHGDAGVGGHQGGLGRGRHLGSRPQARHGGCRPAVPLEGRAQCRWGGPPKGGPGRPCGLTAQGRTDALSGVGLKHKLVEAGTGRGRAALGWHQGHPIHSCPQCNRGGPATTTTTSSSSSS